MSTSTSQPSTSPQGTTQQQVLILTDYSLINSLIPTYDGNTKNLNYYNRMYNEGSKPQSK